MPSPKMCRPDGPLGGDRSPGLCMPTWGWTPPALQALQYWFIIRLWTLFLLVNSLPLHPHPGALTPRAGSCLSPGRRMAGPPERMVVRSLLHPRQPPARPSITRNHCWEGACSWLIKPSLATVKTVSSNLHFFEMMDGGVGQSYTWWGLVQLPPGSVGSPQNLNGTLSSTFGLG